MIIDKAIDEITKKSRVVVGFELGDDYSQISCCRLDQSMPETFSQVMGREEYNIPTMLCRALRQDDEGVRTNDTDSMDRWLFGREAAKAASEGRGFPVKNLLSLAEDNSVVSVADREYAATELIGIFIKKALLKVEGYVQANEYEAVTFTMNNPNPALMSEIRGYMRDFCGEKTKIFFQSHEECFFNYLIHQPEEMWIHDVLLYDYRNEGMKEYLLTLNRNTSPATCFVETEFFPAIKLEDTDGLLEAEKEERYGKLDAAMLDILGAKLDRNVVTSVFLLGDSFSKEWFRQSLKLMCRGRRVFQGNNLFSKGACYGAREKVQPSALSENYIFLSDGKLKANVGMYCSKGQKDIYQPLLNAGTDWYDASVQLDVILSQSNVIELIITPVDGRKSMVAKLSLEGLVIRENKTSRIGIRLYMGDASTLIIELEDKGFGMFFASTGQKWKEKISLG